MKKNDLFLASAERLMESMRNRDAALQGQRELPAGNAAVRSGETRNLFDRHYVLFENVKNGVAEDGEPLPVVSEN